MTRSERARLDGLLAEWDRLGWHNATSMLRAALALPEDAPEEARPEPRVKCNRCDDDSIEWFPLCIRCAPDALLEKGRRSGLKEATIACGNEDPTRVSALGIAALSRAQVRIFALAPYEDWKSAPSPRSEPEGEPRCTTPGGCEGFGLVGAGKHGPWCPKHTPASPPSEACGAWNDDPEMGPCCGPPGHEDAHRCTDEYGAYCQWPNIGRSPSPGKAP